MKLYHYRKQFEREFYETYGGHPLSEEECEQAVFLTKEIFHFVDWCEQEGHRVVSFRNLNAHTLGIGVASLWVNPQIVHYALLVFIQINTRGWTLGISPNGKHRFICAADLERMAEVRRLKAASAHT